jgi:hypothetical protein
LTIVVLLLLAGLWLVVLVPTWLRRQAEFKGSASISDFRYHLRVLERRNPALVPPANRLRVRPAQAGGFVRPGQLGLVPVAPRAQPRRRSGVPAGARPAGYQGRGPAHPVVAAGRVGAQARQETLRRRRQVLQVLLAALVASLALGALPPLHLMWVVSALSAVLLAAYVAVLVHLRNLEGGSHDLRHLPAARTTPRLPAGRDTRVAFLSPPEPVSLLRRSVGS